ncbi:MAG: putative quinol monooxygenase [Saprospiraceae bacterium]
MIKRIVKLSFREETVQKFVVEVFENSKTQIRAFEGCRHMELLRHKTRPNVFFTLSIWDDETALEAYRASALFAETWAKTKALFAEKAEAWTVELID